eukprot:100618-Pelagomonas_calceolata.AAC.5
MNVEQESWVMIILWAAWRAALAFLLLSRHVSLISLRDHLRPSFKNFPWHVKDTIAEMNELVFMMKLTELRYILYVVLLGVPALVVHRH